MLVCLAAQSKQAIVEWVPVCCHMLLQDGVSCFKVNLLARIRCITWTLQGDKQQLLPQRQIMHQHKRLHGNFSTLTYF